ncbi:sigma-54-dependent Fis family transcriptional regulator, partial [Vagococcus salmoninarum]
MNMQESLWNELIQEPSMKALMLPEVIAESWEYCRLAEVNPYITKGKSKIELLTLKRKTQENQGLIDLIKQEITKYQKLFKVTRPIFILTDKEGCIIWREGNHETKDYANDITFVEGSIWTEKAVGTNAIGITLRTNQSVTVHGYEHYSVASHPFTCSSVPIHDEQNQLIGCLDISSFDQREFDQYTLLALQMISKTVQRNFIKANLARKEHLLEYLFKTDKIGVLCDDKNQIVKISEELELDDSQWLGEDLQELKKVHKLKAIGERIYYEGTIVGYFYQRQGERPPASFKIFGIDSKNQAYRQFLFQLQKVAQSSLPVHLYGESGSGKELAAKTIHYNSLSKEGPLVAVNCGALSENLLESELFGYVSGAFTGAQGNGYKGKILQAHGGTLFLDEVDSMSKPMQAALLRVLEDQEVTPLGGEVAVKSEFRVITASNRDLRELVKTKEFRLDLFYRLYVAPLTIPPLRERQEDMQVLIQAFAKEKNWQITWLEQVIAVTNDYRWEGNIRELRNFLERLYLYYPVEDPSLEELREVIQVGAVNLKETPSSDARKSREQLKLEAALT